MGLKAHRLILFVADVPRVAEFYMKGLGLKALTDPKDTGWVDLDAGTIRLGLHKIGTGGDKDVVYPQKLAFLCTNVPTTRAKLIKKGIKLGPIKAYGKLRFCDGKDPEGNPFQLSNRF